MQSFDEITVLGALGRDPEMRYLPNGNPVTSFSIASSTSYKPKDSDEWKTTTRWFRVSIFGKGAEYVNEHAKKGDCVFVKGQLQCDENGSPRIWTGQDGKPHSSFEITARTVKLTAKSEKNGNGHADESQESSGEDYGDA